MKTRFDIEKLYLLTFLAVTSLPRPTRYLYKLSRRFW